MGERNCSEPECERPARARGFCHSHYRAARKTGQIELLPRAPIRLAVTGETTCKHKGCRQKRFSRGLCAHHYGIAWRRGDFTSAQLALPVHRHSLSNIDREASIADCSICGPGVKIRVAGRKYPQCYRLIQKRIRRRVKLSSERRREAKLKTKYRLSQAAYDDMLASQGGVCAICLQPPSYTLYVDHCHETGRVRGLLCAPCNAGLGMLRDDPDRARRAADYLS